MSGPDWTQPLEAVHEDGRVSPVTLMSGVEQPDCDGDYRLAQGVDHLWYFKSDGCSINDPLWTIRNRFETVGDNFSLTLRDQFALAALTGLCANYQWLANVGSKGFGVTTVAAKSAYEYADAMLETRK